jgi:Na+/H+ antiporter NhaC
MFGDNLSFISDTTIAATNTQGVQMKDKFWTNLGIALPAALMTMVILVIYALRGSAVTLESYDYNIIQAAPYFIVLALAIIGINVFAVIGIGILLFIISGAVTGSLTYVSALTSMGSGISGMFETIIVTILVASIGALIRENGGFAAILEFIRKHFYGIRGGLFGISILTALMDIATANNTVAIVMAAPIARQISQEYHIEPKKTASLLDTCSCIAQGIIPYGAQLLIAAGISQISSMKIIPFLFYPYLLGICVVVSILMTREKHK